MADDDERPRPALPPAEPYRSGRQPRSHRAIGALWADTFAVVAVRRSDLSVVATLGAALWLVTLTATYLGVDELFNGQFWEKIDALFDGVVETPAEVDAWMASFDFTLTPQAISLLIAALIASFFSALQSAASAQIARQQLTGIEAGGSAALSIAIARLPALLLVQLVVFAIQFVVFFIGLGLDRVTESLGVLWDFTTLVISAVVAPLAAMLWAMVYLEPGLPSLRRWGRLLGRNKAATWGRVVLFDVTRVVFAMVVFFALLASPLSFAYALAIVVVLVWPLTVGIVAVAHVIMYGDLVSGLSSAGGTALSEQG